MATYWSDMCNDRTCVYRCYDAEYELLYVGMTRNTRGRFSKHASQKPWWKQVAHIHLEWFDNRSLALAEERSAIYHEVPLHNVTRPRMECF